MTPPLETGRVSTHQQVAALLDSDFVWDTAEQLAPLTERAASNGGRRRAYPIEAALVWNSLVTIFGSSRQVEIELHCPTTPWWTMIRRAADTRNVDLPVEPMRRHHFTYLRDRYLTANPAALTTARLSFTRLATQQATAIGICDPNEPGSLTHPSRNAVIAGDGKVVRSRFKRLPNDSIEVDVDTGEILGRYQTDPDAALHKTGTGEYVQGVNFVFWSARGDKRNQRIILGVNAEGDTGDEKEAAVAVNMCRDILPQLPGCQAVVYDGAFRGKHHRVLLKELGVLSISRVHRATGGELKDRYYGPAETRLPDGNRRTVQLHLRHGAPHVRSIDVNGDMHLTPLTRVKTLRRGSAGNYRWYNEYRTPEEHRGGMIRLRLDSTSSDIETSFNREENLRVIAPNDPDHDRLMGRRSDTESGNRLLDDSMLRERAHTVGKERQLLDNLCWAAVRNAVAYQQHRPPNLLPDAAVA